MSQNKHLLLSLVFKKNGEIESEKNKQENQ